MHGRFASGPSPPPKWEPPLRHSSATGFEAPTLIDFARKSANVFGGRARSFLAASARGPAAIRSAACRPPRECRSGSWARACFAPGATATREVAVRFALSCTVGAMQSDMLALNRG
jgi:hypothetical protein